MNISNVAALVDTEGKPHFKYVVEGANLFFTQQARIYLEKRKVVLFKDSSANKGGVTSSSLEVLAGLTLAYYGDLPPGGAIVLLASASFVATSLLAVAPRGR